MHGKKKVYKPLDAVLAERMPSTFSEFVSKLEGKNLREMISYIESICTKLNIKFAYEALDEEATQARVIFYHFRLDRNVETRIQREANGVVMLLQKNKAKVLYLPLSEQSAYEAAVDPLYKDGHYSVIPMRDGTIIGMYYYDGQWIYATSRSFEMTDIKWRGCLWTKAIAESLEASGLKDLSVLNKNKCYTIGFSHPAHHPTAKAPSAWHVQTADPATGQLYVCGTSDQVSAENIMPGLAQQEALKDPPSIGEIRQRCSQALDKFLESGQVDYGYILRSRNEAVTGKFSNVYLPSTLHSKVRMMVYQMPRIPDPSRYKAVEKKFGKLHYVLLDSYMDPTKRDIFFKLFPRYAVMKTWLDNTFESAARILFQQSASDYREPVNIVPSGDLPHEQIASTLKSAITRNFTTGDKKEEEAVSLITKLLCNRNHALSVFEKIGKALKNQMRSL